MALTVLCVAQVAHATCFSTPPASRYSYATISYGTDAANNVAVDSTTGLKWRRCSEGQTWDGSTCTGTPLTYTHEEALSHAQAQNGWRLPAAKELFSIVNVDCYSPAIDSNTFPNTSTSSSGYWTSTPYVLPDRQNYAFSVDFDTAAFSSQLRTSSSPVRLLRAVN